MKINNKTLIPQHIESYEVSYTPVYAYVDSRRVDSYNRSFSHLGRMGEYAPPPPTPRTSPGKLTTTITMVSSETHTIIVSFLADPDNVPALIATAEQEIQSAITNTNNLSKLL